MKGTFPKPNFQVLAMDAVEMAKKRGHVLDFSNKNIKTLDMYLPRMYEEAKTKKISEEQYAKMAITFGVYLGETFIKNTKKRKLGT